MNSIRILIVEDDKINSKILEKMVMNLGYDKPFVVTNCDDAINVFKNSRLDLVLMDISLGEESLDGIETAKLIKESYEVPIIFLTAHSDKTVLNRAISTNPNDYLIKPVNANDLRVSIEMSLYKFELDLENKRLMNNLKQAKFQLFHKEKLASLAQLAGGMAHEINNPLSFIKVNLKILMEYVDKYREVAKLFINDKGKDLHHNNTNEEYKQSDMFDELKMMNDDVESIFDEMGEGLERIEFIIRILREFTKVDAMDQIEIYDLNNNILTTLEIINSEMDKPISIEKNFGDIPQIQCFGKDVNQALFEVLKNAVYAIEKSNKTSNLINIRTYCDQESVYCEINDNGVGIEDKDMNLVFHPFFTTKDVSVGKGLGLSIAHCIVTNRHKGDIILRSEIGNGTTCKIRLPILHKEDSV
ncbi:MAG: response regulator [Clostridiales bacterium]|nr:response regulator [Clostridiales bacterium]